MNLQRLVSIFVAGVVVASMPTGRVAVAIADPTSSVGGATARKPAETFDAKSTNVDLITSGLFTLGIPYLVSVVSATDSSRHTDRYLYAPIAGPWLDLSNRDACPGASCGSETAYQSLLIVDGILQGAGALEIAAGLLFPLPHSLHTGTPSRFRIVPDVARTSAGFYAVGAF